MHDVYALPPEVVERDRLMLVFTDAVQLLAPADAPARLSVRNLGPLAPLFVHVVEGSSIYGFELAPGEQRSGTVARDCNVTAWCRRRHGRLRRTARIASTQAAALIHCCVEEPGR